MAGSELSRAEKERLRARLEKSVNLPSTRDRSLGHAAVSEILGAVGSPVVKGSIPLSKLYDMRRDNMIKFGMTFIKVPLMRSPWMIECSDPQIAAFIDNALRRVYDKLIAQYCLSLDFGYQAIVKRFELAQPDWTYFDPNDPDKKERKVWDEGGVKALVWKDFVALRPDAVEPIWDKATGEFNGIKYKGARANSQIAIFPFQSGDDDSSMKIPLEHALWVTNEKDDQFGSIYGNPRLAYAYNIWWSYKVCYAWADRAFERNADPTTIVYHPTENVQAFDGSEVDPQSIALAIGLDVRSGSTVALPNGVIQGAEGRDLMMREWEVKTVENSTNFGELQARLEYLDAMKLRSIMVPEQALIEGAGGQSSRNVATQLGDIFQESQAVLLADFDNHINNYVIPQLVHANFPEFTGECRKRSRGFSNMDMDLARQILQVVGQSDPSKLGIDVQELAARMNIPMLTPKQQKMQEKEALDAQVELERQMTAAGGGTPGSGQGGPGQAGGSPPVTPATPNMAGVTEFGQYYSPREQINLSEKDFLPDARQYTDQEVIDQVVAMKALWQEALSEAYDEFADYVGNMKTLNLADDDEEKLSRVQRIMAGWQGFGRKVQELQSKTEQMIRKIFERAGNRELNEIGLSSDDWSTSSPEVVEWLRDHSSGLVQGIEETTREQLKNFLARELPNYDSPEELGKAIAAHFSEFPIYRAKTIARTETRDAYNAATLLAGEQVGVKQVQAMDARAGATDLHCEMRDGLIYSLKDAKELDEHPNGTLGFRLLPKGMELSVSEGEVNGDALAFYDSEELTVTFAEQVPEETRGEFLVRVVDELR